MSLVSVRTAQPTPIWRSPLAAAAKPAPRPLLMFHIATEKVLLPSGREGVDKANIGIDVPSINYLINQKTNGRISLVNSRAFTKRTSGPPQSPPSASGLGERVLPGVMIVVEI